MKLAKQRKPEGYARSLQGLFIDMGYRNVYVHEPGEGWEYVPIESIGTRAKRFSGQHPETWAHIYESDSAELIRYPLLGIPKAYIAAVRWRKESWELLAFFPGRGNSREDKDGETLGVTALRERIVLPCGK